MYRKFRNVPIYKDFPPICPYFLGLGFSSMEENFSYEIQNWDLIQWLRSWITVKHFSHLLGKCK